MERSTFFCTVVMSLLMRSTCYSSHNQSTSQLSMLTSAIKAEYSTLYPSMRFTISSRIFDTSAYLARKSAALPSTYHINVSLISTFNNNPDLFEFLLKRLNAVLDFGVVENALHPLDQRAASFRGAVHSVVVE